MNTHKFFGKLEEYTSARVKFSGTEVFTTLYGATKMDSALLDKLASFCEDLADIEKNAREALTCGLKAEPDFVWDFLHNSVEEVSSDVLADFMGRCVEEGKNIPPEEFAQALQLSGIECHLPSPVPVSQGSMIDFDVEDKNSVIMLAYNLDRVMSGGGGLRVYFNIDGEAIATVYAYYS